MGTSRGVRPEHVGQGGLEQPEAFGDFRFGDDVRRQQADHRARRAVDDEAAGERGRDHRRRRRGRDRRPTSGPCRGPRRRCRAAPTIVAQAALEDRAHRRDVIEQAAVERVEDGQRGAAGESGCRRRWCRDRRRRWSPRRCRRRAPRRSGSRRRAPWRPRSGPASGRATGTRTSGRCGRVPHWISSAMSSAPVRWHAFSMALASAGEIGRTPPSPWIGSTMIAAVFVVTSCVERRRIVGRREGDAGAAAAGTGRGSARPRSSTATPKVRPANA